MRYSKYIEQYSSRTVRNSDTAIRGTYSKPVHDAISQKTFEIRPSER